MKIKNVTVEIRYKIHASPQNDWQEKYGVETKKTFSASDIREMVHWLDSQDKWIGWDHNDHLIGERGGSPRTWGDATQRAIFSPMDRDLKDQITRHFHPQRLKTNVRIGKNLIQRVASRYLKAEVYSEFELSNTKEKLRKFFRGFNPTRADWQHIGNGDGWGWEMDRPTKPREEDSRCVFDRP